MRGDLTVVGPQATMKQYLVAGGTKIEAGEPTHSLGTTYSSGTVNTNTFVLAAADTPVIGTHRFGGVSVKTSLVVAAGTVTAQFLPCACPVPAVGRVRSLAENPTSVDTISEAAALFGDLVLIDYSATGASDGGELYRVKEVASADTSGLQIVGIDVATQYIEATPHNAAYRNDVS